MSAFDLPAELRTTLESKLHGLSRTDAARRSASITSSYRSGGNSAGIRVEADALAYALARMPATYAAVTASLNALLEVRADFAPRSLLDCGAGPGTATWAASEALPELEDFTLLDSNAALRNLALELMEQSSRLSHAGYLLGDALMKIENAPAADLVTLSYVINELDDRKRTELVAAAWNKTRDTLLIIEPGTPAGWQRIVEARRQLIELGAYVIAPCPHEADCPIAAPDWCHFSQRLARSRAHMALKGADVPFEDEKFIYAALSREKPGQRLARVLTQPDVNKVAVTAKLCTAEGLVQHVAPKRDKAAYNKFRKLDWGDAVS